MNNIGIEIADDVRAAGFRKTVAEATDAECLLMGDAVAALVEHCGPLTGSMRGQSICAGCVRFYNARKEEKASYLYINAELHEKLHDALHAYRYKSGQWQDTQQALAMDPDERHIARCDAADAARRVFEDCLAHIAVKAREG